MSDRKNQRSITSLGDRKNRRIADRRNKEYECDVCEKRFTRSGHLVEHQRTHTGEKPFECDVCKKRFSVKSSLTVHQRTHNREKPFQCDVCLKRFSVKSSLTVHQRTHTGDKPFQCDVCKKGFLRRGDLAVHNRTHTGEKPYECDVCQKIFSDPSAFRKHKRIHLLCRSCRREIIQSHDVQEYFVEDEHTKQCTCNTCDEKFSDSKKLVKHIARQHGNDGTYKCRLCQELESTEPTGVGYICFVCDVVFDFPRELEDHMTTHSAM